MSSNSKPAAATAAISGGDRCYATPDEVEVALRTLSDADHAKLMVIAKSFCRRRRFTPSVMQPEELISEAVMKTLQMDKKWNKQISMVRHLDRAMENISGHLATERNKIVPFPDGLHPDQDQTDGNATEPSVEEVAAMREQCEILLKIIFGDDQQALTVFKMRAEELQIAEIQIQLHLTEQQYETIARRIRRKLFKFITQTENQI